jgi:hypothetical protein
MSQPEYIAKWTRKKSGAAFHCALFQFKPTPTGRAYVKVEDLGSVRLGPLTYLDVFWNGIIEKLGKYPMGTDEREAIINKIVRRVPRPANMSLEQVFAERMKREQL